MTKNDWYGCFIETIYKKYPKKSQLTDVLTDLLGIEKESVYRRLRKDILFTTPDFDTQVSKSGKYEATMNSGLKKSLYSHLKGFS